MKLNNIPRNSLKSTKLNSLIFTSTPRHADTKKQNTSILKSLVKERRSRKSMRDNELQGSLNKIREVSLIWEGVKRQMSPNSHNQSPSDKSSSNCLSFRESSHKLKTDKMINSSPLHLKTIPFKKYLNSVTQLKKSNLPKILGDMSPASDRSTPWSKSAKKDVSKKALPKKSLVHPKIMQIKVELNKSRASIPSPKTTANSSFTKKQTIQEALQKLKLAEREKEEADKKYNQIKQEFLRQYMSCMGGKDHTVSE